MLAIIFKRLFDPSSSHIEHVDRFEKPATYGEWIKPVQILASLKYLRFKMQQVRRSAADNLYPPSQDAWAHKALKLSKGGHLTAWLAFVLRKPVFYTLLVLAIIVAAVQLRQHYLHKSDAYIIGHHLPKYADLVHQALVARLSAKASIAQSKTQEANHILGKIERELSLDGNSKSILLSNLRSLQDEKLSPKDVNALFVETNKTFTLEKVPFFISPRSFMVRCSQLANIDFQAMLMLRQLEKVMNKNTAPDICRTTMLTAYHIDKIRQVNVDNQDYDNLWSQRIDNFPAVDGALGLTFSHSGLGSLILNENIDNFILNQVLPAVSFLGRDLIIPRWLKGQYKIEQDLTKNLADDINEAFTEEELKALKAAMKAFIKEQKSKRNSISEALDRNYSGGDGTLGGSLNPFQERHIQPQQQLNNLGIKRLRKTLVPSIEVHESYHQIDKKDWPKLDWVSKKLTEVDANRQEHTLEELGAYLVQLAYTPDTQRIWVNKLLLFSLNGLLDGSAEFYASNLILSGFEQLLDKQTFDPKASISVKKKGQIFARLKSLSNKQISQLAKQSFEKLFLRPLPEVSPKH